MTVTEITGTPTGDGSDLASGGAPAASELAETVLAAEIPGHLEIWLASAIRESMSLVTVHAVGSDTTISRGLLIIFGYIRAPMSRAVWDLKGVLESRYTWIKC